MVNEGASRAEAATRAEAARALKNLELLEKAVAKDSVREVSVQCAVCSVQCVVCSVQCAVSSVQCKLNCAGAEQQEGHDLHQ